MLRFFVLNTLGLLPRLFSANLTQNQDAIRFIYGHRHQAALHHELHDAAAVGNTERIRTLVRLGVHVDAPGTFNRTALMLAAGAGHTDTVKVLALELHASTGLR